MDAIGRASIQALNRATTIRPAAARAAYASSSAPPDVPAAVDSVEFTGRAMLRSRILAEPGGYSALTLADRDAIATLYEYAQRTGTALTKVDALAFDLARYRSEAAGGSVSSHPVPAGDTTAQRILAGSAAKDCLLPEDFVHYQLANGGTAAADFAFLEQVLYATAAGEPAESAQTQPAGSDDEKLSPEELANMLAEESDPAGSPEMESAESFGERVDELAANLSEEEKRTLASLYETAARRYGFESRQLRDIDRLARTLATLRAAGLKEKDTHAVAKRVAQRSRDHR